MKSIGIIGAMEEEVAILKEKMEDVRIIKKASMDFYEGTLAGRKTVVVRSGIGKVNAGICAQILADVFSVEAIINTGIAGSLNKDINIGDIVLSTDVVQHDMDATGFGYRKGQIPQMPVFYFAADEKLRQLAAEVCREVNPDIQVFEGRIASGDQFVCDQGAKDGIVSEFAAYATEMEGAAIGQAAYLNEIPFLVIRAISDKADGSAQMDYSEFEKKAIKTDGHMHTNIPNIYAIGDVNGKVMLAHTASHEGFVAVADICGEADHEMDYGRIPSCIYLDPEIACIGLTEKQAKEKGYDIQVGKFPMMANGKSLVEGDTDGIVKVILDKELGEILGVHLYGKHVTDMIGEISVAMNLEATAEEVIGAIHPHPTVSEAMPEAFMAAFYGRAINF